MATREKSSKIIQNARKALSQLEKEADGIILDGINQLRAAMVRRIFFNGLNSSGSRIGSYSRKPMYASKPSHSQVKSSGISPRGKNSGSPTLKNGKRRRSRYLPGGYAEFRRLVGRKSDFINLDLTGQLRSSIKVGRQGGRLVIGIETTRNIKLRRSLERRFGKVFTPTDQEATAFSNYVADKLGDLFEHKLMSA